MNEPSNVVQAKRPIGTRKFLCAAPGAIALVVGLALMWFGRDRDVRQVLVTKHGLMPANLVGNPDYFVVVLTNSGESLQSDSYAGIPIGNGLRFNLPSSVPISQITHVCLYDKDVLQDDMIEQVEIHGRMSLGQAYQFELLGSGRSTLALVGLIAVICGVACLALVLVMFVRSHSLD